MSSDKKDEKWPASILAEARSLLRKAEEEVYTNRIAKFMSSHTDDFLVAAKRRQRYIVVDWKEFSAAFDIGADCIEENFYKLRGIFQEMGCELQRQNGPNGAVMLFYAEM